MEKKKERLKPIWRTMTPGADPDWTIEAVLTRMSPAEWGLAGGDIPVIPRHKNAPKSRPTWHEAEWLDFAVSPTVAVIRKIVAQLPREYRRYVEDVIWGDGEIDYTRHTKIIDTIYGGYAVAYQRQQMREYRQRRKKEDNKDENTHDK